MSKYLISILLSIAVSISYGFSNENSYEKYYMGLPFETQIPTLPSFGELSISITEFGAVGDGHSLNTQAFQNTIKYVASKGGGKVIVPRGIWLTGPIELQSNINLHLEEGALIVMSPNLELYKVVYKEGTSGMAYHIQSPISAQNCENIAITGNGIIDGSGDLWRYRKKGKFTELEWKGIIQSGGVTTSKGDRWYPTKEAMDYAIDQIQITDSATAVKYRSGLTPKLLSFVDCKKVLLKGITFQNPPNWNVHPLGCEDVIIDNIIIRSAWSAQNSDALDIESCNRVLIINSSFDVGDDAICIKSGKNLAGRKRGKPSQNIIIDNCVVYHGHGGFVIGSEMSGGVKNISVRNCTFIGTDVGLRFKSTRGRGGIVSNIFMDQIQMINIVKNAIIFELYYGNADKNAPIPAVSEETPQFKDMHFKNIVCNNSEHALYVVGLPEMNVRNITFDSMKITSKKGILINWAKDFVFKNCQFTTTEVQDTEAIKLFETSNINFQ